MRKVVNIFEPDTCGCRLIFEFDADAPADTRVHTPVEEYTNPQGERFQTVRCPAHQIPDVVELHNKAWKDDNVRKNEAMKAVLDNMPAKFKKVKDVDGEQFEEFNVKPQWRFDGDRNLIIDFPGASAAEKAAARAALAGKFGTKVTLN